METMKGWVNDLEGQVQRLSKKMSPYAVLVSKIFVLSCPFLSLLRSILNFSFDVYEKGILLFLPEHEGYYYYVAVAVTIVILIFNAVGILMYLAEVHIPQACAMMSVYPLICMSYLLCSGGVIANLQYITMYLTLIAGLFMLYAEKLKGDERRISLGLPALGMEKPMGLVTLLSRVMIMFTILTFWLQYIFYDNWFLKLLVFPCFLGSVCVAVGYKTRVSALVMSGFLFLGSLEIGLMAVKYMFDPHETDTWRATVFFGDYCAMLAGVGALLQLACMGGGVYSVDHLKHQ